MIKPYLFIGGPADGKMQDVRNSHPTFTVRIYPPWALGAQPEDATFKVTDHHYTRRELTGGYCVYVHTSIPTHEILPRLLRCYRPDPL